MTAAPAAGAARPVESACWRKACWWAACQQCRLRCLAWQLSLQWQHMPEAVPTIAAALGVAAAHAQDRCDAIPRMQGSGRPGQQLTVKLACCCAARHGAGRPLRAGGNASGSRSK